jgi:hypothetical protein
MGLLYGVERGAVKLRWGGGGVGRAAHRFTRNEVNEPKKTGARRAAKTH